MDKKNEGARAPAGLEGLTRYDYVPGEAGRMVIGQDDEGIYVLRADVERLLATQAVEPAAQAEAVGMAESSTDDDRYQLVRDLLSSAAASVATWNAGALANQQIHSALDVLDYLAAAPALQQVAQASRNDVLEEAIAVIPGGSICDPQHVADAIRALKGEA